MNRDYGPEEECPLTVLQARVLWYVFGLKVQEVRSDEKLRKFITEDSATALFATCYCGYKVDFKFKNCRRISSKTGHI